MGGKKKERKKGNKGSSCRGGGRGWGGSPRLTTYEGDACEAEEERKRRGNGQDIGRVSKGETNFLY